jgi:hypothetical protein
MALSSSALFGQPQPEFQITANVFNAIINGMNNGIDDTPHQLIPVLSYSRVGMAYDRIINEPDFTLHFVHHISLGFRYFFLKNGDMVRQIITNSDVTRIYSVSIVNPNMW